MADEFLTGVWVTAPQTAALPKKSHTSTDDNFSTALLNPSFNLPPSIHSDATDNRRPRVAWTELHTVGRSGWHLS